MGFYSRHILPAMIDCACGARMFGDLRKQIVPQAQGVVLELGFGSGRNLDYYDYAKVDKIYALEPEEGMLVRARRAAAKAPKTVEILPEKAERASLASASVDTVLVTFSLCTIPDPVTALRGARRVVKPGGKLLFCEHGRAPDAGVQRLQQRIEPLWKRLGGGCHLTRDIPALVRESGFQIDHLETGYMRGAPSFAGFSYRGDATAPA